MLSLRRIKVNLKINNNSHKCYYSNLGRSSNSNDKKKDNDSNKRLKTDFNILSSIFRTIWPSSSSSSNGVKG